MNLIDMPIKTKPRNVRLFTLPKPHNGVANGNDKRNWKPWGIDYGFGQRQDQITGEELSACMQTIGETDWPEDEKVKIAHHFIGRCPTLPTLKDCGAIFQVSRERIRQIEASGLGAIRGMMRDPFAAEDPNWKPRQRVGQTHYIDPNSNLRVHTHPKAIDEDLRRAFTLLGQNGVPVRFTALARKTGRMPKVVRRSLRRLETAGEVVRDETRKSRKRGWIYLGVANG